MATVHWRSLVFEVLLICITTTAETTPKSLSEDSRLNRRFEVLTDLAKQLDESTSNSDIFFLSSEPAWIGKTLELMGSSRGNTVGYIPFSEGMLILDRARNEETAATNPHTRFFRRDFDFLEGKNEKAFRKLLKEKQLNPISILTRFEKSGIRTIVSNILKDGSSLGTFGFIMRAWAYELKVDINDALQFHAFRFDDDRESFEELDIEGYFRIKFHVLMIPGRLRKLLKNIFRPTENSLFTNLIIDYPYYHWDDPRPELMLTNDRISRLIEKLTKFVKKKFFHYKRFEELLVIAKHLAGSFLNSTIVFLEHFEWIAKVLEIMDLPTPTSNTYISVPFSVPVNSNFEPTAEETRNYRNLLRSYRLDPEFLRSEFDTHGRRLVIAGNGIDRDSLETFLRFLHQWAEEEKIDLNGVIEGYTAGASISTMNVSPGFNVTFISLNNRLPVLSRLFLNDHEHLFPRLVSEYPHNLWNHPPGEFNPEHRQRIEETRIELSEYIREQESTTSDPEPESDEDDSPPESNHFSTYLQKHFEREELREKELRDFMREHESNTTDSEPEPDEDDSSPESNQFFTLQELLERSTSTLFDPNLACSSRQSRSKRDSNNGKNRNIREKISLIFNYMTTDRNNSLKTLEKEYSNSSKKVSIERFVENQLENRSSVVNKIFNEACEKFDSKINYAVDINENSMSSNKELSEVYLIDATKNPALDISISRIGSTLYASFLGQIFLALNEPQKYQTTS